MENPQIKSLLTADQSREIDRMAHEFAGLSGDVLMRRAGEVAFKVLRQKWPEAKEIAVVCGTGNNGGDGFVVAELAKEAGLKPVVYLIGDAAELKNEALRAFEKLKKHNVVIRPYITGNLLKADLVVDAIFGTGLKRPVSGLHAEAIHEINSRKTPVLSIDLPSGLCADSGNILGDAVIAEATTTFIGIKRGLLTAYGPDHAGKIVFDDLAVPHEIYKKIGITTERLDWKTEKNKIAPRLKNSNKGLYGHVVILGGYLGMSGAPKLAGMAALRTGAGLVSIATHPAHDQTVNNGVPEIMGRGIAYPHELAPMLDRATVLAIGPGLGTTAEWSEIFFEAALASGKPSVVDADALKLLAQKPRRRDDWILTPHPGEAGRLLGVTSAEIQKDRFAAARALQKKYGGVIVLKGCGTVVCDGSESPLALCPYGNPGMASAGMGDVLSGVIAALMAQHLSLSDAARIGVCLHAKAGDAAAGNSPCGMIATDLLDKIRILMN